VTYTTADGLVDDYVKAIAIDGDDNKWFGTNNGVSLLLTEEKNIHISSLNKSPYLQNAPNPFNSVTTIKFTLPEASDVKVTIYNILGQQVTTLVNDQLNAGTHSIKWDGSECASGVYICRLETGSYVKSIKILLMK